MDMNIDKIFIILIMLAIFSSCNSHEGISIQNHSSDTIVLKVFNKDYGYDIASLFLWKYHTEIEDFVLDTVIYTKHSRTPIYKEALHNFNTNELERALAEVSTDSSLYYRRNLKLLFHKKAVIPLYTIRELQKPQVITDSVLESKYYPPTPEELLVINRYFQEQDSFINYKRIHNVELMIPPQKELIFLCGGGADQWVVFLDLEVNIVTFI